VIAFAAIFYCLGANSRLARFAVAFELVDARAPPQQDIRHGLHGQPFVFAKSH
jgi:hypothetical protein